jgi:hypothetical protein
LSAAAWLTKVMYAKPLRKWEVEGAKGGEAGGLYGERQLPGWLPPRVAAGCAHDLAVLQIAEDCEGVMKVRFRRLEGGRGR